MRNNGPHRHVFDDDDDDDDSSTASGSFRFQPLTDGNQRRLSDASDCSDCSSACPVPPPSSSEPQMDPFRTLQPRKVAVIHAGGEAGATSARRMTTTCASVLRRDGHIVTVFTPEQQQQQQQQRDFPEADGVTLRSDTRVVEMAPGSGNNKGGNGSSGWEVTYQSQDPGQRSRVEFFDYAIVMVPMGADDEDKRNALSFLPEQSQEQLWTAPSSSSSPASSSSSRPHLYRNMISPDVPNLALMVSDRTQEEDEQDDADGGYAYVASIWLSTVLYKEMALPSPEQQRREARTLSVRGEACRLVETLLRDLGLDNVIRARRGGVLQRLFGQWSSYSSSDNNYRGTLRLVQDRRRLAEREGWGVQLYAIPQC
jgi:hypothetical protein